ncbi:MAG: DNRLRE domain-containing protein, partial [Vicinamibacterales bacterium]
MGKRQRDLGRSPTSCHGSPRARVYDRAHPKTPKQNGNSSLGCCCLCRSLILKQNTVVTTRRASMNRHFSTTPLTITFAVLVVYVTAVPTPVHAQTVHVTDDTNINLATPTQLNGATTSLFVRNIGAGGERRTFLQFDLSTLPSGVPVNKAMLRLWVSAVNDPGPVDVHAVLAPWGEETLSASVAPPIGAVIGSLNLAVTDQNKFVLVDITNQVQGWLNGSIANFGIALVPVSADPIRVTLDSKETTLTSHGPELEVALTPATGDITTVSAGLGLSGGGAAGDVSLSLDTGFTDSRYAAAAHGHDVSQITNAATLGANTFTGTQTIDTGNLDLDPSTATSGNLTKNGTRFLHNFGTLNTFLGVNAGNVTMTGTSNTATGFGALANNTTGGDNTAVGSNALFLNSTGGGNTAFGNFSMQVNTTGIHNTASGVASLVNNTTGSRNTVIGVGTMTGNTAGSDNTAAGFAALANNSFGGSNNVGIGRAAGRDGTTGSNNIYLGANVLGVAGELNTMYLGLQGAQTTTFIAGVRGTTVTGGEPVVIDANGRLGSGTVAPAANSVGTAEVIDNSLTASDLAPNAVTGSELAADAVTADKVAFNYAASTAEGGAAIDVACLGCVAANEVNFSFASLGANTFTGTQTIDTGNLDLDASTATVGSITKNGARFLHNFGTSNTFLGVNAGNLSMSGSVNTAMGSSALESNTTGNENTAVGAFSLFGNTLGIENTAIGASALRANTTGISNTAIGREAMRFSSTGSDNTAIGQLALRFNVSGSSNTALGHHALMNTTGSNNVGIGNSAGGNATTGSNNIYLGWGVLGVAGEADTMYLGKIGTQTTTYIAGVRGTTVVGGESVVIDAAGRLGSGAVPPGANTVGSAQVIDDSLTAGDLA